ncbi:type II toxin-antitoxin system YoeB family toxin [Rhodoferax sp.]|uniref:type II toxin-antitoxin system YoeB family toxin n=1 Tax=Rhodoferax sp. TaxID=50421 RepID=UPI0037830A90
MGSTHPLARWLRFGQLQKHGGNHVPAGHACQRVPCGGIGKPWSLVGRLTSYGSRRIATTHRQAYAVSSVDVYLFLVSGLRRFTQTPETSSQVSAFCLRPPQLSQQPK